MNSTGACASIFHALSKINSSFFPLKKASTKLHRYRMIDSRHRFANDICSKLRITHECRTITFGVYLARRAPHVDIDVRKPIAQIIFNPCCRVRYRCWFMTKKLNSYLFFCRSNLKQVLRFLAFIQKRFRRHHFGVGHIGTLLYAKGAHGFIAHASHRPKNHFFTREKLVQLFAVKRSSHVWLVIHFQNGHKRFLGHFNITNGFHALFALFLLFKQLTFTRYIATITFR